MQTATKKPENKFSKQRKLYSALEKIAKEKIKINAEKERLNKKMLICAERESKIQIELNNLEIEQMDEIPTPKLLDAINGENEIVAEFDDQRDFENYLAEAQARAENA